MSNREPIWPLIVGAIAAVIAHAGLLPVAAKWLAAPSPASRSDRPSTHALEPVLPEPNPINLGREAPQRSSVAWIPYDAFLELIAPQSKTEQPALQQQADPVPQAPMPIDPTPASASASRAAAAARQAEDQAEPTQAARNVKPAPAAASGLPLLASTEVADAVLAGAQQSPIADRTEADRVVPTPVSSGAQANRRASSSANAAPSNPTSAARSDRESSPVKLRSNQRVVRPGAVIVGDGIEIKTVQPRFSVVTRVSTLPHNPLARVTFDHRDGRVIQAELIRSSGYPDVDGPVEASLYLWRASGRRLAELDRPFELKIELIMTGH